MVELNWDTNRKEHLARVALKYYRMLRQGLCWERNKQTQGQRERDGEMGRKTVKTVWEETLVILLGRHGYTVRLLGRQWHITSSALSITRLALLNNFFWTTTTSATIESTANVSLNGLTASRYHNMYLYPSCSFPSVFVCLKFCRSETIH